MSDIFISYSRANREFTKHLYDALLLKGYDVWVDWDDIEFAEDWWAKIKQGIEAADNFLFIITPTSVRSKVCFDEIQHAVDLNKRIVPLLHQEVKDKADVERMHPAISQHNWLPFLEENIIDRTFGELLQTIASDPDHVKSHTRLVVKSNDWLRGQRDTSLLLRGQDLILAEKWLLQAISKDPAPTKLQVQYIEESRKSRRKRQKIQLTSVTTALVISLVLTLVSFILYREANQQKKRANEQSLLNQSLALSYSSQLALSEGNGDLAIAFAMEAVDLGQPPLITQQAFSQAIHTPGTRQVLHGNNDDEFWTLAVNPTGKYLAAGGENGNIVIWNMQTSQTEIRFTHNNSRVWGIAFNPQDQRTMASVHDDGTLIIWDILSQKLISEVDIESIPTSLTYSKNGEWIVVGTDAPSLLIWDISRAEFVNKFPVHIEGNSIRAIDLTEAGDLIFTGSTDGYIISTNSITGSSHNIQDVPAVDWIYDIDLADNGFALVVTMGDDVQYWDLFSSKPSMTYNLKGHTAPVLGVALSADGTTAVSASADHSLILWNLRTGTLAYRLRGHLAEVTDVVFSHDQTKVYSASLDGTIRVWDIHNSALVRCFDEIHISEWIRSVNFGSNDSVLSSADEELNPKLFSLATGELIADISDTNDHEGGITGLFINHAHSAFASTSRDGKIIIWDWDTRQIISQFSTQADGVLSAAFTPNDKQILASLAYFSGTENRLVLWDTGTHEVVLEFENQPDWIRSVDINKDGSLAISGAKDGKIILWDMSTGEAIALLQDDGVNVQYVSFSHDGNLAVSASDSGRITIWDVKSRSVVVYLDGHLSHANIAVFLHDDKYVLSGGGDNVAILWEVSSGIPVQRLENHTNGIWSIDISTDEQFALTGAEDGQICYWRLDNSLDEMVDWTKDNRYLYEPTCSEWHQYGFEEMCD